MLVVDDEWPTRFSKFLFAPNWVFRYTPSYNDVHEQWDAIFLDHDLGGAYTIKPFVHELCESKMARETPIIIHSMNPVGASNISASLRLRGMFTSVFVIPAAWNRIRIQP